MCWIDHAIEHTGWQGGKLIALNDSALLHRRAGRESELFIRLQPHVALLGEIAHTVRIYMLSVYVQDLEASKIPQIQKPKSSLRRRL